jgi:hypothetical protein
VTLSYAAREEPALPGHATSQLQGLGALEFLLAGGWQIDPPVLVRLSWAQDHLSTPAYHFIMARDARRSLVVIMDSPELQHFLVEHAIAVA